MAVKNSGSLRVEIIVKIITSLIGAVGFLSIFSHVGVVYRASFLVLYGFSVYGEYRNRFLIPRRVLNALALAIAGLTLFQLSIEDLVVPIVEALTLLLAIKFLEEKKFRDYMQICAISVLLLCGSALLSLDLTFLLYFACLLLLLPLAIVFLTYLSQDQDLALRRNEVIAISSKSLLIPAAALPMTVFLFVILPRSSYPLLTFLNNPEKARTGFSDNVKLGGVSEIQEDNSVVFRVAMEKIDPDLLYWRGIVMEHFDGREWRSLKKGPRRFNESPIKGERIRQTVFLEPYESRFIFTLDKPVSPVSLRNVTAHEDLTFSLFEPVRKRMKYEVLSVVTKRIPAGEADKRTYLQLPEDLVPDIRNLASTLSSGRNDKEAAAGVAEFFTKGGFRYSLKNLPLSSKPLEDFLFTHKYGNCEYFASAMAVVLRAAGIPSRIVGGYRGGYYNDIGGYYLIPQSNAHVWVEAYLKEDGWVRLDPTPSSPDPFASFQGKGFLFRMQLIADSVNYYWNAFVINYTFEKQLSLLHKVRSGIEKPELPLWLKKGIVLKVMVYSCLGFFALRILRSILSKRKRREGRVIERFLRRMERSGYTKRPSEGLEEFAARIQERELREKARVFVNEFEKRYYRDEKFSREEIARLKEIIKGL